ncbi:MAG: LuxR C-terminal-related transcriptional regulator [Spirochaetaceae bacterium]|jgi:LuxR family maltose regulon positive regulatory protein|nr:LuxR C-terminal-related transcriptional regulator [Spirochaetaceae bacterium]
MGENGLLTGSNVFLKRPRVDRILEKALQSHVVTVVAGEGYGKTYAVNSFLQEKKRNTIWVQLSERDNLGWRFWENYTSEVARINPEAAKLFSDMGFPESGRQFNRYLNLIKDEVISKERYVLVFDDFHFLTNLTILRNLELALSVPVSKNTIVLISRTHPAINTLNLLAKGRLAQVAVEDLRFTKEEIDAYFRLRNVTLEEEELARIFYETEGWALALGLILQEIKAEKAGGRHWDRVMQPVRKMEEDIFSTMEEELQKFLIKLSLIERWPQDLLERLELPGKNIVAMEKFSSVIRFDVYLHGFRIHNLFLDFLREKQNRLSREEIQEVCRKGAQWNIENNLPTDAALNYERVRDYGGLCRLIESLPRIMPKPRAVFFLKTVERLIEQNPDDGEDDNFLSLHFVIRPRLLTFLGRYDEAFEECRKAIAYFEAPGPQRPRLLTAVYNNLGILGMLSSRDTHNYDFGRWFEKAYQSYMEDPQPIRGQMSQTNIGSYMVPTGVPAKPGEIDVFIDAISRAVPYVSVFRSGSLYGADSLARAELAYYQGDLVKAEQFALKTVYQGREKKQYEVENRGLFYLMRIGVHKGDAAAIRKIERQLESQLEISEYLNRYTIHDILSGRFYARIGLVEKVAPWLRNEDREGESGIRLRGFDTLVKIRCLVCEKNYSAALKALEEEKAKSNLKDFIFGFLEISALEMIIRHQLGDKEGAFTVFRQAYDAALPNSLDMPFIELGEHMVVFVNAFLKFQEEEARDPGEGGIPKDWLQVIRKKSSVFAKKRALVAAAYTDQDTAASPDFSAWELEILNHLSQGYTSEKIAGTMNVSINMIKSAVRSLYAKLGAANRADAIRMALQKDLLSNVPE